MRESLAEWLSGQLGEPVEISRLTRLPTGHSRAMFRVDLAGGRSLVLRAEQGGVFGTTGDHEFRVMEALGRAGFPVAPVLFSEPTGEVIGQPFFVMEFVEGDERGREDRSLSSGTAQDLVRHLAELHRIDDRAVYRSFGSAPPAAEATASQVDRWSDVYRGVVQEPIPLLEEAAAWLHHNAPPLDRLHVVHADPGPGNFIHRDGKVVAITDWEFCHLGDPMEDWVYLVVMRGARSMPPDAWLELFREVAGVEVGATDLRYWSAFNLFKGACANRTALAVFRDRTPAPNLAIIGTALHQTFMRRLADVVAGANTHGHTS